MTYEAEITWYDTMPHGDDFSFEETFAALQGAVDYIQHLAKGRPGCRAWINDKEVTLRGGYVLGADGSPLCTNEAWHKIFATHSQKIAPRSDTRGAQGRTHDAFRPRPTRGCAPQNPATLAGRGEEV